MFEAFSLLDLAILIAGISILGVALLVKAAGPKPKEPAEPRCSCLELAGDDNNCEIHGI